jgi:hypothetical protein
MNFNFLGHPLRFAMRATSQRRLRLDRSLHYLFALSRLPLHQGGEVRTVDGQLKDIVVVAHEVFLFREDLVLFRQRPQVSPAPLAYGVDAQHYKYEHATNDKSKELDERKYQAEAANLARVDSSSTDS